MRSFVKIKYSQNDEITLSITNIVKSCPSREFLASQICYLTLFAKIKFSRKFPNLQHMHAQLSSGPRRVNFGLNLYSVCVSSEGSDETVQCTDSSEPLLL